MRTLILLGTLAAPCVAQVPPQSAVSGHAFADPEAPQITLEVRFLAAPQDVIRKVRKDKFLRTATVRQELTLPDVTDQELAGSGGIRLVSAKTTTESHTPVFVETLKDDAVRHIIQTVQKNERSNILFAPKVTLFNRQTADIRDTTSRPFVVGLQPSDEGHKKQIRTVDDGLQMVARCQVQPKNSVRIDFRARHSVVNEVGLLEAGPEKTIVQVPKTDAHDIQLAAQIPDGQTLVIWGVPHQIQARTEAGVPVIDKVPYVSRMFKSTGTVVENQEFVIMLTPRILRDEDKK